MRRTKRALSPPVLRTPSPNTTLKFGKGFKVHWSYLERDWLRVFSASRQSPRLPWLSSWWLSLPKPCRDTAPQPVRQVRDPAREDHLEDDVANRWTLNGLYVFFEFLQPIYIFTIIKYIKVTIIWRSECHNYLVSIR
jgi:hypothetical protein